MNKQLRAALRRHFNATGRLTIYDDVRDCVELFLRHKGVSSLEAFTLRELFEIAQPFTNLTLDKELLAAINKLDPDKYTYKYRPKRMLVCDNELTLKLLAPLTSKLYQICPRVKFWYRKYSIVVTLDSKPIIRYETITHRRYRYLYGTVVIEDVRSEKELQTILPKFIIEGDYKVGVRLARKQGVIRNVTGTVLIRVARHLRDKIKIV